MRYGDGRHHRFEDDRQVVRRQGNGPRNGAGNGHCPCGCLRRFLHLAVARQHGSRNGRAPGGILYPAAADRTAHLHGIHLHGSQAGQTARAGFPRQQQFRRGIPHQRPGQNIQQQGILDQQQEDAEISAIMSEMYANGQAWGSASDEEKQRLADENLRLGRLLAPYGINAVRGDDGVWYVDRVGGEQLFQKYRQYIYHDGGIVGEDSLKSNEVFAKLQKGEAVFTSKQYKNLFSQIGDTITGVVDSVVRSLATAKDTTAAAIQSVTNNENTDNSMGEIRIENHFEVKNADEETAKKMAEYYADYTIDKLIVARKRKGVRNSVGSHMLR